MKVLGGGEPRVDSVSSSGTWLIYIKISPNTACAMIMPPMKYRSDNGDFGLTVT